MNISTRLYLFVCCLFEGEYFNNTTPPPKAKSTQRGSADMTDMILTEFISLLKFDLQVLMLILWIIVYGIF
jgi:hypothetical protein